MCGGELSACRDGRPHGAGARGHAEDLLTRLLYIPPSIPELVHKIDLLLRWVQVCTNKDKHSLMRAIKD